MTYRLAAKFYDLFGSKDDLEFYRELAVRSGESALELGVGTARVAIPLARAGVRVVGLDNSEYMLEVAREKLAKEPEVVQDRVTLSRGDMMNLQLDQTFSFVYLPASTFDHCVTVQDRTRCLSGIYHHLEEQGKFAFDIEQVSLDKPAATWWIDRKETNHDETVVRSIFTRRDLARRICNMDLFFDVYQKGKLVDRYHEYGEVAILFKDEVENLLKQAGFRVEAIYGDFDKSEFRRDSSRAVFVTNKT